MVWVRRRAEPSEWADLIVSHSLVIRGVGEEGRVVGFACRGVGDDGGGVMIGSEGPWGISVVAGVAARRAGSGGGAAVWAVVVVCSDGPGGSSVVAGLAPRRAGSGGGAAVGALVFLGLLNWRDARVGSSVRMWWIQ